MLYKLWIFWSQASSKQEISTRITMKLICSVLLLASLASCQKRYARQVGGLPRPIVPPVVPRPVIPPGVPRAVVGPVVSLNDVPIISYVNENNYDGSYKYSFETGNGIIAQEEGYLKNPGQEETEAITAQGSYSYTAPDGQLISVTWIADENGFHATSNHGAKAVLPAVSPVARPGPVIPPIIPNIRGDVNPYYRTAYYETGNGIYVQEEGVLNNPGVPDVEAQTSRGSYSYTAPDGQLIQVTWYADETGFHAEGAHIPKVGGYNAPIPGALPSVIAGRGLPLTPVFPGQYSPIRQPGPSVSPTDGSVQDSRNYDRN